MPNKRRAPTRRKSPAEWGLRGGLAAVAAVIGFSSVADTIANVVVRADPTRAHSLAPRDGRITAALAEEQFELRSDPDPRFDPARLARLALKQDATATKALNVLGLQAQLRNDTEQARRLFTYSLALSRRELQPRIWAIEEAVSRGDITQALQNYDIALRISRNAPEVLFPTLSTAIAEPKVRSALLKIMEKRPIWEGEFIDYLALRATDPRPVVEFFREGERAKLPVSDEHRARVVNALVAGGYFDAAWSYYSSIRRISDRSRSRDPDFSASIEVPTAFDWMPTHDPALSATILRTQGGGLLELAVPPSASGSLAQQMQMLPPGTYRLEGLSAGVEQSAGSLPYWSLRCGDGRELGRVTVPNSGSANARFTGQFKVPAGCRVQTLALVARSSNQITGVTGQILKAELAPAE